MKAGELKIETALANNDVMLNIAPYLDCSDLMNLALTSRRLLEQEEHDYDWSLVEEVSRQMLCKMQTDNERDALPRYTDGESWLSILHELELLRSPLVYDQLVGNRIDYVRGDMACITSTNTDHENADYIEIWTGTPQTAISNHIMRRGKHYAKFTLTGCHRLNYWWPGIMRPINWLSNIPTPEFCFWDSSFYPILREEKTGRWGESNVHCCWLYNFEGHCTWGDWESEYRHSVDWDGMEGSSIDDCEFGMLLDLDAGTLTVYKDGRRLGVMKDGMWPDITLVYAYSQLYF